MKPRTKAQVEVFNLSKIVLDVEDKIKDWAFKECNEHIGIATKKYFWCIDCGNEHSIDMVENNKVTCPACNTELNITKSLKRTFEQSYYVAFAEVLGDYQVVRLFEIISYHKKYTKAIFSIRENVMQFIPPDHSKIQYIGRMCNTGAGNPRYGALENRKPSYYKEQCYNPYPFKYYPGSQFKDEYSKYGINHELQGLTFLGASKVLKYNNKAETLLKAKQFSLFAHTNYHPNLIATYWASIKIAMRNNYVVADASLWLDYLDLLSYFLKDLRSPKYLFPIDLNKAHDRLVEKKKKIDKEKELKERLKQIKQEQKNYSQKIQDFVGLEFSKGKLSVKVLETIQDFIDEADTHKHCVYTNKYYSKDDSLIFSATYNGKKVETVELSLSKLKIIQSRGFGNEATKYHKSIISLVNENLDLISQRKNKLQNTA
ncbi:PcfJ domain-containing protein [Flavobacterium sp. CBA20B-1]|uniref:PcfJ domain-containing protein n=1 Tax=unclassified Flavobacterium TaxID=196869 RepID=UPI0022250E87|nr:MULTISPECIES: PcfJ domain-containing protein [unclassified Flavobacterium]WCM42431.1 PcfJ domain-containing protein [Flavobacterium sp. CBA20B-1]